MSKLESVWLPLDNYHLQIIKYFIKNNTMLIDAKKLLGIPMSTFYRKVNQLIKIGLLISSRNPEHRGGKRYLKYKTPFDILTITITADSYIMDFANKKWFEQ